MSLDNYEITIHLENFWCKLIIIPQLRCGIRVDMTIPSITRIHIITVHRKLTL